MLLSAVWGDQRPPASSARHPTKAPVRTNKLGLQITVAVCLTVVLLVILSSAFEERPTHTLGQKATWLFGLVVWAVCTLVVLKEIFVPKPRRSPRDAGARSEQRCARPAAPVLDLQARGVPWPRVDTEGPTGTADGVATARAPFSGAPCVAWAIWIGNEDGILLRDARCVAHALVLDDGTRVEIPDGRIDFAPSRTNARRHPMKIADEFLLERRLHPPPSAMSACGTIAH